MVEAGLLQQLEALGWAVEFGGHHQFVGISAANDPPIGKLRNPRLVSSVTEAVAHVVGAHAKKRRLPVTLGGDHSLVCVINLPIFFMLRTLARQWVRYRGRWRELVHSILLTM
jgi:arginase family enzyme